MLQENTVIDRNALLAGDFAAIENNVPGSSINLIPEFPRMDEYHGNFQVIECPDNQITVCNTALTDWDGNPATGCAGTVQLRWQEIQKDETEEKYYALPRQKVAEVPILQNLAISQSGWLYLKMTRIFGGDADFSFNDDYLGSVDLKFSWHFAAELPQVSEFSDIMPVAAIIMDAEGFIAEIVQQHYGPGVLWVPLKVTADISSSSSSSSSTIDDDTGSDSKITQSSSSIIDDDNSDNNTNESSSGGNDNDDSSGGNNDDSSGGNNNDDSSGGNNNDDSSGGNNDDSSGGNDNDDSSGGNDNDDSSGGNDNDDSSGGDSSSSDDVYTVHVTLQYYETHTILYTEVDTYTEIEQIDLQGTFLIDRASAANSYTAVMSGTRSFDAGWGNPPDVANLENTVTIYKNEQLNRWDYVNVHAPASWGEYIYEYNAEDDTERSTPVYQYPPLNPGELFPSSAIQVDHLIINGLSNPIPYTKITTSLKITFS